MSGGRKKRRDINDGLAQQQEFANQALARFDPFVQPGVDASAAFNDAIGVNGADASQNAFARFEASPFATVGENAFRLEDERLGDAFSAQGLNFSGARLEAQENARLRSQQNAFSEFLGNTNAAANRGFNAAGAQAGILTGSGQNAFNAGLATANTRQGALGTLRQVASIGRSAFTGGGFI